MKRFHPYSACIKCGSREAGTKYESQWKEAPKNTGYFYGLPLKLTRESYMVRSCKRCGYEWRELPLDAPEEAAS